MESGNMKFDFDKDIIDLKGVTNHLYSVNHIPGAHDCPLTINWNHYFSKFADHKIIAILEGRIKGGKWCFSKK